MIASAFGCSRKRIYRPKIKEAKDSAVKRQIDDLHLVNPAYGHKRVALALGYSKKKALRIMRKYGIKPPRRKAQKVFLTRSTDNRHYTNLIKNTVADRPNQVFVSDRTCLKFQGKNIYLATIEDIFTREIVSAEISDKHDSNLALKTVRNVVGGHARPKIFHTDQGSEFMAQIVTGFLEENGVKVFSKQQGIFLGKTDIKNHSLAGSKRKTEI